MRGGGEDVSGGVGVYKVFREGEYVCPIIAACDKVQYMS